MIIAVVLEIDGISYAGVHFTIHTMQLYLGDKLKAQPRESMNFGRVIDVPAFGR